MTHYDTIYPTRYRMFRAIRGTRRMFRGSTSPLILASLIALSESSDLSVRVF